jgi:bifunctional DNA-binding transcriptional regulator/antitoxin component of YhaV-PrlF toxin-antitoxin module
MSIEFLTKVNENGIIFLPEEYRHLQSHLVKVQLDLQEEDVHISSWYERVVLDEIIGDSVRVLISANDQDIEREEYLSCEQYCRLVELAPHEPIIEGDVHLIKYERIVWNDGDKSQFVIKKVQRITELARREIIDLHKRVFSVKGM